MRNCFSPEEKLVITLRYLGSGCSIADLRYVHRLGKSTVSGLLRQCVENALDVLEPKPISTAETACYPHIIVRDEAFGIIENVMKPDSGKQLTYRTKIFNYELPRDGKYIECTFDGIMANKWRMFHNLSTLKSTLPKT
ncbi:hypothetical protein RRG08_015961 [Elysia crispata]|uniref:Uncharacterized protein n=1 Tax=Elysia crispata TaxID=231223 RepID=A0AAE1DDR4_9GAST|nr:hypothetical protein RRG08_015961 [Elysia crispata]